MAHRGLVGTFTALALAAGIVSSSVVFIEPAAAQQAAATQPVRVRATITSVSDKALVVKRGSGDPATISLDDKTQISSVRPLALSDIKPGSFVGVASRQTPDGKHIALEVLVFPEAARGSNEGHYPWDLLPQSSMTNANVDTVVQGTNGRELKLSYKGGTQTITVPENAPVVTFAEATAADLVAGRKVFVIATAAGPDAFNARRVVVEKNGVAPPM